MFCPQSRAHGIHTFTLVSCRLCDMMLYKQCNINTYQSSGWLVHGNGIAAVDNALDAAKMRLTYSLLHTWQDVSLFRSGITTGQRMC